MYITNKGFSTYQQQLQTYPHFYPQLTSHLLNKRHCAYSNLNIHLSTVTTTRTTNIYMINNMRRKKYETKSFTRKFV
jgi:hypothetical protein